LPAADFHYVQRNIFYCKGTDFRDRGVVIIVADVQKEKG
jgi:hypothetical protein